MADIDWGATERTLREEAQKSGVQFDPSDLADVQRNASYEYNQGTDPSVFLNQAIEKLHARGSNAPNDPSGRNWDTARTPSGTLARQSQPFTPFTIPTVGGQSFAPTGVSSPFSTSSTGTAALGGGLTTAQHQAAGQQAGSPMAYAQQQGWTDQLNQFDTWLNENTPDNPLVNGARKRATDATAAGVNLFDPATWGKLAGSPFAGQQSVTPQTTATTPTGKEPTGPLSDDPNKRLLQEYALDRFQHLQNPEEGSGTQMFESYLKELATILQGAPFSDTEMAQLKNSVYQDLLTERDATSRRWLELVSQRGFMPSSGPALEGLQQIDLHFQGLRTAVDNQFALAAIQQRQSNQMQAANVLGTLAGNEENRLTAAGNYAGLPYNLDQQWAQGALNLVNTGGSPGANVGNYLGILQAIQNSDALSLQQKQNNTNAFLYWLAQQG